jgi:cyclophilin family peptidyl-prolyl cis-trans isomerase
MGAAGMWRAVVIGALLGLVPGLGRAAEGGPSRSAPRWSSERVLLRTNRGDLVLALYPDLAPRHTSQILRLVRLGVYDTTSIHRVQRGFLVQLTNAQNRKLPLRPEQTRAIQKVAAEFSNLRHAAGMLSMAREDNDPNSAETSFSILLGPAPHLDGKYTIFGELEWGMPLLTQLANEPVDDKHRPLHPVLVEEALVKSAEEISQLRAAGLLREVRPLPQPAQQPESGPVQRQLPPPIAAGIVLMMACGLLCFLMAGRWKPQTLGAVSLLTVLTGGFLLFIQLVPIARSSWLVAVLVFVGMVSLFKLMNRFESAGPPRPAPPPEPPRS